MTVVLVELLEAARDGGTTGAQGRLVVSPMRRYRDGDALVLTHAYKQVLIDGHATLYLDPTVSGMNAWRIEEDIVGGGGITRIVAVPEPTMDPGDSTTEIPVLYADLSEVNPVTLA